FRDRFSHEKKPSEKIGFENPVRVDLGKGDARRALDMDLGRGLWSADDRFRSLCESGQLPQALMDHERMVPFPDLLSDGLHQFVLARGGLDVDRFRKMAHEKSEVIAAGVKKFLPLFGPFFLDDKI